MSDYTSDLADTLADTIMEDESPHSRRCNPEIGCVCGLREEYERYTTLFYDMIDPLYEDDLEIFKSKVIARFETDNEWAGLVEIIKQFNSTFKEAV